MCGRGYVHVSIRRSLETSIAMSVKVPLILLSTAGLFRI